MCIVMRPRQIEMIPSLVKDVWRRIWRGALVVVWLLRSRAHRTSSSRSRRDLIYDSKSLGLWLRFHRNASSKVLYRLPFHYLILDEMMYIRTVSWIGHSSWRGSILLSFGVSSVLVPFSLLTQIYQCYLDTFIIPCISAPFTNWSLSSLGQLHPWLAFHGKPLRILAAQPMYILGQVEDRIYQQSELFHKRGIWLGSYKGMPRPLQAERKSDTRRDWKMNTLDHIDITMSLIL